TTSRPRLSSRPHSGLYDTTIIQPSAARTSSSRPAVTRWNSRAVALIVRGSGLPWSTDIGIRWKTDKSTLVRRASEGQVTIDIRMKPAGCAASANVFPRSRLGLVYRTKFRSGRIRSAHYTVRRAEISSGAAARILLRDHAK